ncbi:Transcription antitermination protein NusB [Desulfovibrionales bacterium]
MIHPNTRRVAREQAFQLLYGLNFIPANDVQALAQAFALVPNSESPNAKPNYEVPVGFAWELIQGVWEHREAIDTAIGKLSRHWRIQRIGCIELTILRLALYEMLHRIDVPAKVTINESIKLAKRFGSGNSRDFVTGILDAAARAIDHDESGLS